MQTIVVQVRFHHNSSRARYKYLMDLPDGADPDLSALIDSIITEGEIDEVDPTAVSEALQVAKATGKNQMFTVTDQDDEKVTLTVWHRTEERGGGLNQELNFGFGDGTDKYNSTWLDVAPYTPDPLLKSQLEVMDRDAMIDIMLRTAATTSLNIPPT